MAFFKVSIQTPDKTVIENIESNGVIIPTPKGPVHLLPEHTHMVSELISGIIRLDDDKRHMFFITKGICKIIGNNVNILSPHCDGPEDIDKERVEKAISNLEQQLKNKNILLKDAQTLLDKLNRAKQRRILLNQK